MIFRYVLSFLMLFSSLSFADTGHPYWPMTPGTSITYQVFAMTGFYDVPSGKISVVSNTYDRNLIISYSANGYDGYVPAGNLYVSFYHEVGTPNTPVPFFTGTLQDSKWVMPDNFQYLGEMVNNIGNTVIPPEAKLTKSPVVGEVLDTNSVVRVSPTNNTIMMSNFHWKYRTIEYLPTWGVFTDCWRTGLREYNTQSGGPNDMVYNYVFMKDKGLVNFWYGSLSGTTVTGYQFYAISY